MTGPGALNDDTVKRLVNRRIEAVAIGASAGGVQALLVLLTKLSVRYPLPIIVGLHMPDTRESRLAEVFQHHSMMTVRLAEDKAPVLPGTIYFAASGYHLSVERSKTFSLSCEEPVHYSRPSIDVLMTSAADAYGASLAGILLTGASHDGALGMAAVHRQGGLTIVQDPAEAEIATMPQAAINLFKPDFVLPLAGIQQLLVRLGDS